MKIKSDIKILPGIIFTALIAIISQIISQFIGVEVLNFSKSPISSVMMAVVIGLLLRNFFTLPEFLKSGIQFSVKKLLKLSIILLGIRLSIGQIFDLGSASILIVILNILIALNLTKFLANKFKINKNIGTLIGAGTAICGVTAIVTISPLIEAEEEETAYSIAVISIFGLIATLLYPYIANWLFPSQPTLAGIFLGASIHDTSQVTGAALLYTELFQTMETLNAATITKLIRNISMVFVIPILSWSHSREGNIATIEDHASSKSWFKYLPSFALWFIGMSLVRWLGDSQILNQDSALWLFTESQWTAMIDQMLSISKFLMLMALSGVGLNTEFKKLSKTGIKPMIIGFTSAITIGLISAILLLL